MTAGFVADELSPIKRDQLGDYLAMRTVVDGIPDGVPVVQFRAATLSAKDAKRSIMGLTTAIKSVAMIGSLSGETSESLDKAIACTMLIAGGIELTAAMSALLDAKTVMKIGEGVAHLAKYNLAAPIVAGIAIAAAAAFSVIIADKVYDMAGDSSTSEGIRDIEGKLAGVLA